LRRQRSRNNRFPESPYSHQAKIASQKNHNAGDQPGVCRNHVLHKIEEQKENTLKGMYNGIKHLRESIDDDLKNVE
jgi:hypothetical protein